MSGNSWVMNTKTITCALILSAVMMGLGIKVRDRSLFVIYDVVFMLGCILLKFQRTSNSK